MLTSLHHLIDREWMLEAYRLTRKDGAPGIDGMTAAEYEANLEANLDDLLTRLKSGRYIAPPVRRHYIPKADGTITNATVRRRCSPRSTCWSGRVIGQCMARHRHQEFIRFLNKINRETPAAPELHLIVDNYATHKHPKVRAWLERHPRFHFHFTPTSASWLNAVEGFFAKLTKQRLKRGVFKGIVDLQAAINRYLAEINENPKPFTWTADPDAIIEKVGRGKQALESIH